MVPEVFESKLYSWMNSKSLDFALPVSSIVLAPGFVILPFFSFVWVSVFSLGTRGFRGSGFGFGGAGGPLYSGGLEGRIEVFAMLDVAAGGFGFAVSVVSFRFLGFFAKASPFLLSEALVEPLAVFFGAETLTSTSASFCRRRFGFSLTGLSSASKLNCLFFTKVPAVAKPVKAPSGTWAALEPLFNAPLASLEKKSEGEGRRDDGEDMATRC